MNNTSPLPNSLPIVEVTDLKVHFPIRKGILGKDVGVVKAVDGISFAIPRGTIMALVGESGCGKTTTAMTVAGLTFATSGSIALSFADTGSTRFSWNSANSDEHRTIRQRMQFIFQDPYSSLNPRMTVRAILEEPLIIHKQGNKSEREGRIMELLSQVGLSQEYLTRYPHEFSGGQRQRIGIARALATTPEFIIADEPVSALDVSIQAQIINLLLELKKTYNQTQLFISHDLAVVRHIADTIAVMYMGKIVEQGDENDLFSHPLHPYTLLLLDSIPVPGKGRKRRGAAIVDDSDKNLTSFGCSFYPRCPRRKEVCSSTAPSLTPTSKTHMVACFNPAE